MTSPLEDSSTQQYEVLDPAPAPTVPSGDQDLPPVETNPAPAPETSPTARDTASGSPVAGDPSAIVVASNARFTPTGPSPVNVYEMTTTGDSLVPDYVLLLEANTPPDPDVFARRNLRIDVANLPKPV
ncbi:MAG: hypothetical protein NVS3B1_21380 [Marmoricola sp.]